MTLSITADQGYRSAAIGSSNSSDPNPWTHRRLDVWFDHPDLSRPVRVPGYFAGNGSGARNGRIWRAHFTPTISGDWMWFATFEKGHLLNAAPPEASGTSIALAVDSGAFSVGEVDPGAPGFQTKGTVTWDGSSSYFRFSEPGAGRYVQAGVGSPENFLGYAGFTGVEDGGSANGSVCCCKQDCFNDCHQSTCANAGDPAPNFLHRYETHVDDWSDGDPDWTANGQAHQGRGIIGALNYLGNIIGVNSMYFMVMNLGGDGKDTYPFLTNGGGMDCPMTGSNFNPLHTLNYDPARMDQWRTVLEHANNVGIMPQILLAEQEACNIRWFGAHSALGGPRSHMSVYRRLFLKQMVAEFGHLLALRWNLCEENKSQTGCSAGPSNCGTPATPMTAQFTAQELDEMGRWIRAWEHIDHPIGVHTSPNETLIYSELLNLPQIPDWLSSTSLQIHGEGGTGSEYEIVTKSVQDLFAQAGIAIPLMNDEQGDPQEGLSSQQNSSAAPTSTAKDRRRRITYDILLSGGQLCFYFGYYTGSNGGGDLRTEDFRTRSQALKQLVFAREVADLVKIWDMEDRDSLLVGQVAAQRYARPEVAATPGGQRIVVYYPALKDAATDSPLTGRVDLRDMEGFTFELRWLDTESRTEVGDRLQVQGGQVYAVPTPDIDGDGVPGNAITEQTDLILLLLSRGPTPTTTE